MQFQLQGFQLNEYSIGPTIANICDFDSISIKIPSFVIIGMSLIYLPAGGKTEKSFRLVKDSLFQADI